MPEDKVFNLDKWRRQWDEYIERKRHAAQEKLFVDEVGELFKELARDARIFQIGGRPVAKVIPGQLNKTLLAAEQPDIVKECTRTMTVERFDETLFKQLYPDLFKHYQSKRLVVDPQVLGSAE